MHACVQIDLRSDYERRHDGLGLLLKNARVVKAGRHRDAQTAKANHKTLNLILTIEPSCPHRQRLAAAAMIGPLLGLAASLRVLVMALLRRRGWDVSYCTAGRSLVCQSGP